MSNIDGFDEQPTEVFTPIEEPETTVLPVDNITYSNGKPDDFKILETANNKYRYADNEAYLRFIKSQPAVSASSLMSALNKPEPEKGSKKSLIVAGVSGLLLTGIGCMYALGLFSGGGEPTPQASMTATHSTAPSPSASAKGTESTGSADAPAEDNKTEAPDEGKDAKPTEGTVTQPEETTKPSEAPVTEKAEPKRYDDKITKVISSSDGVDIWELSDATLPPYQKPDCAPEEVPCNSDSMYNGYSKEEPDALLDLGYMSRKPIKVADYPNLNEGAKEMLKTFRLQPGDNYLDESKARYFTAGYAMFPVADGMFVLHDGREAVALVASTTAADEKLYMASTLVSSPVYQLYAGQSMLGLKPLEMGKNPTQPNKEDLVLPE